MESTQSRSKPLQLRGAAWEIFNDNHSDEACIHGPAGTGKSSGAIARLHYLCSLYPEIRCLMVRKTRKSLTESGLVTFEKILGDQKKLFSRVQRQQRHDYVYPNGSVIVVGGMDDAAKIMSTDFDLVYCQEARELTEDDWESLTTRLRNNKLPFQQIFGDTNPDTPTHWLRRRMLKGQTADYQSYHQDNPALYDNGEWTPLGKDYIGKLDRLTGVRRDRLLLGKWVQAEGVIYDTWDQRVHLRDWSSLPLTPEQIELGLMPSSWRRFVSIDFGYRGAFICQWWAIDEDGRIYLYREIYRTGVLVEDHAREMKAIMASEPQPEAIVCDHDAEGRATLERYLGRGTIAANKNVLIGIQAVQARLRTQGDGLPRLFVMRGSLVYRDPILLENHKPTCFAEEVDCYVWSDNKKKEEPLKENDHSMDCARYATAYLDLRGNLDFDVAFIG